MTFDLDEKKITHVQWENALFQLKSNDSNICLVVE